MKNEIDNKIEDLERLINNNLPYFIEEAVPKNILKKIKIEDIISSSDFTAEIISNHEYWKDNYGIFVENLNHNEINGVAINKSNQKKRYLIPKLDRLDVGNKVTLYYQSRIYLESNEIELYDKRERFIYHYGRFSYPHISIV